LEKRRHFDWSWQAVRYRYRSSSECQDEFKALLASPSGQAWQDGFTDEEVVYRLERCIYMFFMSGLSVFESFAFGLYFLGNALRPSDFPDVATPRKITLKVTAKAFTTAFPSAAITGLLTGLPQNAALSEIDEIRNLLAHRLSGRRSRHSFGDGQTTWHEDTWHIPGAGTKLTFDEEFLQRHLDDITGLLTSLASAARAFAETNQPTKAI
jgi:hypothetical protein